MTRRMLRYSVAIANGAQTFRLGGNPVHVEAPENAHSFVDFWAEDHDIAPGEPDTRIERTFQVFGTGHPLPEGARWWGTTARTSAGLVWHLYEVPAREQGEG